MKVSKYESFFYIIKYFYSLILFIILTQGQGASLPKWLRDGLLGDPNLIKDSHTTNY